MKKELVQTGLFGGDEEAIKHNEEKIPFTLDEVNAVLEDAPRVLLEELNDSIQAILNEIKKAGDTHRLTESKKRFWLNLEWVFELSESPAVLPFDVACGVEGLNSELIRNRISMGFGPQIREFLKAYASAQPLDQARVKRKLNRYICVAD
jgi:hypothetical protein